MNELVPNGYKVLLVTNSGLLRAGIKAWLSKQNDIELLGEIDLSADILAFLKNKELNPNLILFDVPLAAAMHQESFKQISMLYPITKMIVIFDGISVTKVLEAFSLGIKGCLLQSTAEDEFVFGLRQVANGNNFICMELNMELWKRVKWNPGISKLEATVAVHFSERELEILNLIASGFTNQEISDQLFASKRTIEGYRQQMINKAKVKNTAALVKFCILNGILPII